MTRHIMAIALVASVFCSGTWAAQSDDPGPVRVGDRWSYDLKDGATGDLRQAFTYVVAEINDREIITRLTPKGHENRTQTVVYDLNWAIVDNGDWQYRPGEVGIKTPLHIGKEWRWDVNAKNMRDGRAFRTTGVVKVVGKEQVTTQGGFFDTFRVEAKGRLVSASDQRSTMVSHVFWYAPAINRWVKRTFETRSEGRLRDSVTEELTGYSRKP